MIGNFSKTVFITLGLILLGAGMSSAQEVPGRTPPISATINATQQRLIGSSSQVVRVPLNKAVAVRLDGEVQNIIVVEPAVADFILPSEGPQNYVYIVARSVGSTTAIFEDTAGNIIFEGDVQVDVDVAGIKAALVEMFPEEKIDVTSHREGVFLRGFVRSAISSNKVMEIVRRFVPDALNITNSLEILGSQQVVMQVRIAEIRRTALKELGIDTSVNALNSFGNGIGFTTAGTGVVDAFIAGGTIGTGIGSLGPIAFDVLETQGLAKTLAEPMLTAKSGQQASFNAGGQIPIPILDASTGQVSTEFRDYGVGISFTPVVLDKGLISLSVTTEVSAIDNSVSVLGIPGLTTKTTSTTVEIPSGGTLLIAGLIQDDFTNSIDGVPGLKDLPILGALFRSESFNNTETELVITMTAYLANPTSNARQLALPTDGFAPSSDIDFYLLGRLHKVYTGKELPPYATPVAGPYGYIME